MLDPFSNFRKTFSFLEFWSFSLLFSASFFSHKFTLLQVAVVGKVISVREDNVTYNMVIDDGTGRITSKTFITGGDDLERQRLAELREGIYVKAFGHIATYHNERQLTTFSAKPITDYNEVTYHLSRVIFEHLQHVKGGAEMAGGAAGVPKV